MRPLDDDRSLDNLLAAKRLAAHAEALADLAGLTIAVAELAVLDALDRRGAQDRAGIACGTGLARSTVSRVLIKLEVDRLVRLDGVPGATAVASLTAAGRRLLIAERKAARIVSRRIGELYPAFNSASRMILEVESVEMPDPTGAAREGAAPVPRS